MVSYIFFFVASALASVVAIILSFGIFKKVFQENYKKPWLFIGISAVFFGLSQIIQALSSFYSIYIINANTTEIVSYLLEFVGILSLAYGLLLEYLILKYYKGKFVKMTLVPVQEGSFGGKLAINVSKGTTYFAYKKDVKFLFTQAYEASKSGFESFLITEKPPLDVRHNYGLEKSPIVWLNEISENLESAYSRDQKDENSELVDPIQLNKVVSYIDLFLENSSHPFVVLELNQILRKNNFDVSYQLLSYIVARIEKYNGVLICLLNEDVVNDNELQRLRFLTKELE